MDTSIILSGLRDSNLITRYKTIEILSNSLLDNHGKIILSNIKKLFTILSLNLLEDNKTIVLTLKLINQIDIYDIEISNYINLLLPSLITNLANEKLNINEQTLITLNVLLSKKLSLDIFLSSLIRYGFENDDVSIRVSSVNSISSIFINDKKDIIFTSIEFIKRLLESVIARLRDVNDMVSSAAKREIMILLSLPPVSIMNSTEQVSLNEVAKTLNFLSQQALIKFMPQLFEDKSNNAPSVSRLSSNSDRQSMDRSISNVSEPISIRKTSNSVDSAPNSFNSNAELDYGFIPAHLTAQLKSVDRNADYRLRNSAIDEIIRLLSDLSKAGTSSFACVIPYMASFLRFTSVLLNDSNLKIVHGGLDIISVLINTIPNEVKNHMSIILSRVVEKISDKNQNLRQATVTFLVRLFATIPWELIVYQLCSCLKYPSAVVRENSIILLTFVTLISDLPTPNHNNKIDLKNVALEIANILSDQKSKVVVFAVEALTIIDHKLRHKLLTHEDFLERVEPHTRMLQDRFSNDSDLLAKLPRYFLNPNNSEPIPDILVEFPYFQSQLRSHTPSNIITSPPSLDVTSPPGPRPSYTPIVVPSPSTMSASPGMHSSGLGQPTPALNLDDNRPIQPSHGANYRRPSAGSTRNKFPAPFGSQQTSTSLTTDQFSTSPPSSNPFNSSFINSNSSVPSNSTKPPTKPVAGNSYSEIHNRKQSFTGVVTGGHANLAAPANGLIASINHIKNNKTPRSSIADNEFSLTSPNHNSLISPSKFTPSYHPGDVNRSNSFNKFSSRSEEDDFVRMSISQSNLIPSPANRQSSNSPLPFDSKEQIDYELASPLMKPYLPNPNLHKNNTNIAQHSSPPKKERDFNSNLHSLNHIISKSASKLKLWLPDEKPMSPTHYELENLTPIASNVDVNFDVPPVARPGTAGRRAKLATAPASSNLSIEPFHDGFLSPSSSQTAPSFSNDDFSPPILRAETSFGGNGSEGMADALKLLKKRTQSRENTFQDSVTPTANAVRSSSAFSSRPALVISVDSVLSPTGTRAAPSRSEPPSFHHSRIMSAPSHERNLSYVAPSINADTLSPGPRRLSVPNVIKKVIPVAERGVSIDSAKINELEDETASRSALGRRSVTSKSAARVPMDFDLPSPRLESVGADNDSNVVARANLNVLDNPEYDLKMLPKKFQSDNWKDQSDGLTTLRSIVVHHCGSNSENLYDQIIPLCKSNLRFLLSSIENLRSQISCSGILTAADLFCYTPKAVEVEIDLIVTALYKRSSEASAFIRQDVDYALSELAISQISMNRLVGAVLIGLGLKSDKSKLQCLKTIEILINSKQTKLPQSKDFERLIQSVAQMLNEGANESRQQAKQCILALNRVFADTDSELDRVAKRCLKDNQYSKLKEVIEKGESAITPHHGRKSSASMRPRTSIPAEMIDDDDDPNSSSSPNLEFAPKIPVRSSSSLIQNRRPSATPNTREIEGLNSVIVEIGSLEWKTRSIGIDNLVNLIMSQPDTIAQYTQKIFDAFVPRLSDSNSKINLQALEKLLQFLPIFRFDLNAVSSLLVTTLATNLASNTPGVKSLSEDAITLLVNVANVEELLQPFASVIVYGNLRVRPFLITKLSEFVEQAYLTKSVLVTKHILPIISVLLDESKLEKRIVSQLIKSLHNCYGSSLFTQPQISKLTSTHIKKLEDLLR